LKENKTYIDIEGDEQDVPSNWLEKKRKCC
jgi:hypothetical protein